jgi:dTDP-4-dehydrorhamnose 3,5-epimerase
MTRLIATATPLSGLWLVARTRLEDERGHLSRLFCAAELASAGWTQPIAQVNLTHTRHCGTVRGLHYQRPPYAEAKLVSCLRGEAWDLAVDLRPTSPTYLQWHAQRLSPENGLALLIPPGFAHGFQAMTDDVELLYCHSAAYTPAAEAGLHPQDPRLAIAWPLPVSGLSPRDASHAWIGPGFEGVRL